MQSGTHIIFKVTSPPFRTVFRSALVTNVHMNGHIEIIMNCANEGGVVKKSVLLNDFLKRKVYKITYAVPLYDSRRAIERAESRLNQNERCYHVLKNNSHFFVTYCITGREQALADILRALEDGHQDHLKSKEVERAQKFENEQVFKEKHRQKGQKVREEEEVGEDWESEEENGSETEQEINELEAGAKQRNGKVQEVEKVLKVEVGLKMGKDELKNIFYQISIPFCRNLKCGDHILSSDSSQHYLVESVSHVNNKFSAYTLDKDNNVQLVRNVLLSSRMLRIELGHVPKVPSSSPEPILRRAQECISSEWISSEYFVTKMKYGTGYLFDNIQCFMLESEIKFDFEHITPEVQIAVGDHLMIRDHRNPEYFHSGIVYSCPDHTRVKIMPQLGLTDVLDVTLLPEVYRVEYSSFLPCDETLLRAKSKQGEDILRRNPNDYSCFVNWAKTGQTKCIPPGDTIMNDKSYEKVTRCNQIQKGDHLIQLKYPEEYPDGLRHLLVTECAGESKQKILFCKRNYLREQVKELKGEVYIVRCQHEGLMPEDIVERGRKQIGQKYNPWDRMLFIVQAKSHQSEETSVPATEKLTVSRVLPCSRSRIMCFNQVSPGDYIIKEPTISNKTIDTCHHYLVVSVHGSPTHCEAIESDSGNIKRVHCIIEADTEQASYVYYRINYELGTCIPAEKSITSAQELVGKQSHIGSDRFVHYIKTGNVMIVTLSELRDERDHVQQVRISLNYNAPVLGNPVEYHRITTTDTKIPIGTHILYKVNDTFPPSYRSALVIGTQQNESDSKEMILEFITNTMKDGIIKQSAEIKDLQNLSKVLYLFAGNSAEDAVTTAREHLKHTKNFFHHEFYNSHHFVTMCVTGRECSLVGILVGMQCEEYQGNHNRHLKPILFKVEVNSLDDINPADHVVIEGQHYLVGSKDIDNGKFSVYTVDKSMSHFMKRTVRVGKCIRIDYCVYGNELIEPSLVLERAEKMLSETNDWKSSEGFVSKMKCGAEYYFNDRCLMSDNVRILSLTKVTPHISIEEGNHLVLLRNINDMTHLQYQSVLVCKCIDSRTIDIISPVDMTSTTTSMIIEQKEIDIHDYTVYRVNYSQCLPSDCVLERARSKVGEGVIATCANPHRFIAWAKTGKMLDMPEEFPEKSDLKIADILPLRYEKIMSPDEIQIGDHLFTTTVINFIDHEIRKNHFLVTDRIPDVINPIFKVIYLSAGLHLKEAEHEFNPRILEDNSQVYRVVYSEAFPCQLSIKRLRSQFKHQHLPTSTCAASLIRWAKTGSQEGLEANFLTDSSLPTSKSQLACFTQLNPGDYVVKMSQFNHHYLVISVESPTKCRVIESWRRKVEEKVITCNNWPNESTYFRINYDPGQCINAEQSIKMARDMCTNPNFFSRYWKPKSECARESFVHFVKTGERSLNIENLHDDRLFLQREIIKSAFDLCIGDHIERPLSIAPTGDVKHHMLVVKPVSPTTCLVIHYKVEKSATHTQKGDIVCEVVDIFKHGDVFRIFYPERTDPKDGIGKLASKLSKEDRERLQNEIRALAIELSDIDDQGKARLQSEIEYHLKNNNCEHLIMFATIGIPVSIQVNKIIHHALCCTKRSLRAFRGSLVHRGAKCTPNELMHMSMVCKHGALAMAGGIEFAISVAVELPILIYNIRKLKIKEKFGVISEEEFKRHVLKEVLVGCGVVAGGTAGTIAGQVTIPVPVLGAVIGGLLGGLLGQWSGTLLAILLGHYLIQEKKLTLPKTLSYSYNSLLEY